MKFFHSYIYSYFRHYSMYKYAFTKQQKLTLNTINVGNNKAEEDTEEMKEDNSEENGQPTTEEGTEVYIYKNIYIYL